MKLLFSYFFHRALLRKEFLLYWLCMGAIAFDFYPAIKAGYISSVMFPLRELALFGLLLMTRHYVGRWVFQGITPPTWFSEAPTRLVMWVAVIGTTFRSLFLLVH